MKKSNKKYVIVLLVVLLLGLAVGYAAMNDTLNITGTANAKGGDLDMIFTNACAFAKTEGINADGSSVVVSGEGDQLNVTVKDLHYPGAGAQVHVQIKNVGTLPAKLNGVKLTDDSNLEQREGIVVKGLDTLNTAHNTMNPGSTCEFDFTVEWDKSWTNQEANPSEISFGLQLDYTQDTNVEFSGEAGLHQDA